MDRGIECTLSKLADNTKLCGAVNLLEGRDAIKRDLDRRERWVCANFIRFNKAKCKVLHMGWDNPQHKYRLGREWIENNPKGKDFGVLLLGKYHVVQVGRCSAVIPQGLDGAGTTKAPQVLPASETKIVVMEEQLTTTLSSWSGHARKCNETAKSYCVNGGVCYYIEGINQLSCKCPNGFFGQRCLEKLPLRLYMPDPKQKAEELYQKRVLTITGICVALLVVGIVCVVAYCKTKKQRKQMHNHLRQNMCPAHQNRSLANGPSHPRLDPEEIQMADYISKNVSATEHVIRRETETTFSGSHSCSPSHHCSTATPTSSQRHESHTWSLERTESLTSDSQSGIMLSSVGTSKCNSPACMEARARRGAAFCIEDSRRHMTQYRDSVDSLRDSPHSERYVSALTTPARLSPVDFHYSMAAQVPTFEITSPNSAHAVSLPPAAPISFRVEEQQRSPSRTHRGTTATTKGRPT
ncbi:neuregulin 2 [Columba livia]|uniref:Neuregulin 2 n=1 Tax=Columba livia TaxID=8932 RepID=A0A2I0MA98_COLLI|nr:neuregulin 2 [Columba livia]